MFRYIAFVWNRENPAQSLVAMRFLKEMRRRSPPWHVAMDGNGLAVFCAGVREDFCKPQLLANRQGIILGKIFAARGEAVPAALGDDEMAAIAATRGRHLVDHYWGRYICFIRDETTRRTCVVRDPAGIERCFMTEMEGVRIFCSNSEDCASLGLYFSINWPYVASMLALTAGMNWEQTGINELAAIRPGSCLEIADDEIRSTSYWDPVRIAMDPIENTTHAAAVLRDAVRRSVRAWASCHPRIALLLSGGLDSSIILSCLQDTPYLDKVSCFCFYDSNHFSDERMFAKLAAQRAGCELRERLRSFDIRYESLLTLPKSARPSSNNLDNLLYGVAARDCARECGATAVFMGQMGDQLFGERMHPYAVMDYLWMHGLSSALFRIATDVSRVDLATSTWKALCRGISNGIACSGKWSSFGKRRLMRGMKKNPLINPHVVGRLDARHLETWIAKTRAVPMGTLVHIAHSWAAQAYHDIAGVPEDPDWVMPLYSQPIIEVCLRLPTYLLCHGGWDRSIARQAFVCDVPRDVISRRLKGTAAGQRRKLFAKNIEFIRELLLDGFLVKEGLLDRRLLEESLEGDPIEARDHVLEQCITTEAWVRVWLEKPPQNPSRKWDESASNDLSVPASAH